MKWRHKKIPLRAAQLGFESLEDRQMLTVVVDALQLGASGQRVAQNAEGTRKDTRFSCSAWALRPNWFELASQNMANSSSTLTPGK